jgi:hypothetical protein
MPCDPVYRSMKYGRRGSKSATPSCLCNKDMADWKEPAAAWSAASCEAWKHAREAGSVSLLRECARREHGCPGIRYVELCNTPDTPLDQDPLAELYASKEHLHPCLLGKHPCSPACAFQASVVMQGHPVRAQ